MFGLELFGFELFGFAYALSIGFCGFLTSLSLSMLINPAKMRKTLAKMGSTNLIHFSELGIRLVLGLALYTVAPATDYALGLKVFGGFMAVTAVIIMVLPRRWHQAYAQQAAKRLTPTWIKVFATLSLCGGLWLLWTLALYAKTGF